jgi:uncharacterized damage-inducible protein DinB
MSLFLQTLVLRGILFRAQEHRQERIGVGMTLWPTGPTRGEDKMKRTIAIPALLLLAASATAQTTFAQTKDPVGAALRNILPGRQKNTVAAVEAMPADKFNYKPSADQMTFGHLVAHMVETNNLLCSKAAAVPATNGEQVKDTDSKDNLVAALKASFDFCSDALANMDDSKLAETTEGFGGKQVTRAWLSLILAGAWADHYAEAAMYLRLNGVLPPTAKK